VHVKVGPDCRVLVAEVERAIDRNTILIVGSAPQYCHAVIGNKLYYYWDITYSW